MNVAIIGSGGREHALGWKIKQSPNCGELFFIPGNCGTSSLGTNLNCDLKNFDSLLVEINKCKIDFVIIGPEQPLVDGLSDFLRENKIVVFGPSKSAAQIEASKFFAKEIMRKGNVPTANFAIFNLTEVDKITNHAGKQNFPVVVKADGLAAGKGVKVCSSIDELNIFLEELRSEILSDSNTRVLVEEFMEGDEASIFAITDGEDYILLPAAQDHKRIGEGDTGDNTGGMGAYAPTSLIDNQLSEFVAKKIIEPTLKSMRDNETPFSGCLYAGLMISNGIAKVVEFNCRFGDPETQAVLPILEGDFLELLYSAAIGKLGKSSVHYKSRSAICVIAASAGYPKKYNKGFEISGLSDVSKQTIVFHSGTKMEHEKIFSNGGRVIGVTFLNEEDDLAENIGRVYSEMKKIKFENIYFRKDVGQKGLKYLNKRN